MLTKIFRIFYMDPFSKGRLDILILPAASVKIGWILQNRMLSGGFFYVQLSVFPFYGLYR